MRTTMDIYSHVMPALARAAADRMGAVLLGGTTLDGTFDGRTRAWRTQIVDAAGAARDRPTARELPTAQDSPQTVPDAGELQLIATTHLQDDLEIGESPDQMGGAEGTRTPDPHTASIVRTSNAVPIRPYFPRREPRHVCGSAGLCRDVRQRACDMCVTPFRQVGSGAAHTSGRRPPGVGLRPPLLTTRRSLDLFRCEPRSKEI